MLETKEFKVLLQREEEFHSCELETGSKRARNGLEMQFIHSRLWMKKGANFDGLLQKKLYNASHLEKKLSTREIIFQSTKQDSFEVVSMTKVQV